VCVEAAYRNAAATQLWQTGVVRGAGPGLRRTIAAHARTVELRTPSGIITGEKAVVLQLQVPRVQRVVERIVKGLLWHHYQRRPAANSVIEVHFNPNLIGIQDILLKAPLSIIGSMFRYRHALISDDPNCSIWGLQFYDHTHFFVLLLSEEYINSERYQAATGG
jgi:hypothetical protein